MRLFSQKIERDATFGLSARFFKKRAIFKKVSSNTSGRFGFPKAESDALELRHKTPINLVAIKLDTNTIATASNIQVSKDSDGFFNFGLPKHTKEQLGGYEYEEMAPLQFVAAKVGIDEPNPVNQISPLGSRRSYTAPRFLVYKSRVSSDDRGQYVTIERNEREFFSIEEGDTVSTGTMPIATSSMTAPLSRFFNNNVRAKAVSAIDTERARSMKLYLNDLPGRLGYSEGDLVQVFGLKV